MIRTLLAATALAAAALLANPAAAQQQPAFVELNPPLPTDSKDRIEVVEFFWYECPHCFALEPYLEAWVRKLPKDVEFRRVPATFNDRWNLAARVYYALEAMGLIDKLHRPLMDAIHKDRLRITDEKQLSDWLQRQGVDVAKFSSTLKSFAVEGRLKRAQSLVQGSKIDGVPALMVNGQYVVGAGTGGTEERMLAIADLLVERARKSLAATAPPATPAKKK